MATAYGSSMIPARSDVFEALGFPAGSNDTHSVITFLGVRVEAQTRSTIHIPSRVALVRKLTLRTVQCGSFFRTHLSVSCTGVDLFIKQSWRNDASRIDCLAHC